jgi:DNA-directed RNA polymerase specialized sigma24 family protein
LQETQKQLSEKEQQIIRLRVFEEKEFAEVAILLAKEESAVRKHFERTMKAWFTLYKKRMGE